jgi:hypothetical protein
VGPAVENTSHTLERLLTCSVPNLQLYHFVLYFDSKGAEFDSYRHLMLRLELIVHHSLHQARLSDTSVSNDNKFK